MSAANAFDVCIVGGGPGGLAALSAVLEPYSADQLSDGQTARAGHAYGRAKCAPPKVCIVDPAPWLDTWHKRFKALDIKWLRSPAGAHPDTFDKNTLLAFAENHDRKHEFLESGVVSKELASLPEASSGLWNLPSNELFEDFCSDLASRLSHTYVRGKAASIGGADGCFSISLTDGRELTAKAVILALGVPGPQAAPPQLADLPGSLMVHSDAELGSRLEILNTKRNILVIGGGLTAVQVAQLGVKKRCKVVLASRRPLTTRHFDVDATWFDRRRANCNRFEFFNKPIEERLKHIKAARGGGSVPPMYMEAIREAEAFGSLVIKCGEVQLSAVHTDSVDVTIDGQVQRFDLIVNACGHRPDCQKLPLISELLKASPVDITGGFPTLSDDLQWGDFKRLFVIGALASLQVGPDAGNLMGLTRAAQIVAHAMDLKAWMRDTKAILTNVRGNRYQALETDSDSDATAADSDDAEDSEDTEESERQDPCMRCGDA
mmetsp:Transcript_137199/g.293107  ORF Transcript_137199/g.293107 Transcript_137199/m.293107 type:complete len:491 (+) Transcript_137199:77-1549(+)